MTEVAPPKDVANSANEEAAVFENRITLRQKIQIVFYGLVTFLGHVIGILNFGRIVEHYGFHWLPDLAAAVQAYRDNFYPVYDFLFLHFFAWLRINLSTPARDVITIYWLAFLATNTESLIRDRQVFVAGWFRTWINIFSGHHEREWLAPGMFGPQKSLTAMVLGDQKYLTFSNAISTGISIYEGIAVSLTLAQFAWRDQPVTVALILVVRAWPQWFLLWLACGAIFFAVVGIYSFVFPSNPILRLLSNIDAAMRGNRGTLRPVFGPRRAENVLFAAAIPCLIIFLPLLIALSLIGFAVSLWLWLSLIAFLVVSNALLAPLIAWRSASLNIGLFGLLMISNWLVSHH